MANRLLYGTLYRFHLLFNRVFFKLRQRRTLKNLLEIIRGCLKSQGNHFFGTKTSRTLLANLILTYFNSNDTLVMWAAYNYIFFFNPFQKKHFYIIAENFDSQC